jgi:hypothetical protein
MANTHSQLQIYVASRIVMAAAVERKKLEMTLKLEKEKEAT